MHIPIAFIGMCALAHALLPRRIASLDSVFNDALFTDPKRYRTNHVHNMVFPKRFTHYTDSSGSSSESSDGFSDGDGPALMQMLLSRLPHEAAIGRVRVYDDSNNVLQINVATDDYDDLVDDEPTMLEALDEDSVDIEIALYTEAHRIMLEIMADDDNVARDSEIDRNEDLLLDDDLFVSTALDSKFNDNARRARVLIEDTLGYEPEVPSAEEYSMLAIVTATIAGTLLVVYILFLMYKVVLEAVETQAMANHASRPAASHDLGEEAPLLPDGADSEDDIESQANASSGIAVHPSVSHLSALHAGPHAGSLSRVSVQEAPHASPATLSVKSKGRKKHRGIFSLLSNRFGHSKH